MAASLRIKTEAKTSQKVRRRRIIIRIIIRIRIIKIRRIEITKIQIHHKMQAAKTKIKAKTHKKTSKVNKVNKIKGK